MIRSTIKTAAYAALALGIASPALAQVDNRDVVHNTFGNIVHNTYGNCVRTQWPSDNDECAPKVVAQAPAPQPRRIVRRPIAQEERTVYFGFNKSNLNAESVQKLNTLATNLKSDSQVREARIVGYADRIGNASYNQQLSQRRAETVNKYLISQGVINSRVTDVRWLGESQPATQCPDNLSRNDLIQCLQKDRRVEVEIEYLPENTVNTYPTTNTNRVVMPNRHY